MKTDKKIILAQAASELAIFGAILLFVIGGLIRSGFQQSMQMNQQLRAMRMALSESWRSAQGQYSGSIPSISRTSASVLVVEDRLSIDATQKYGTRDRIPFVAMGSGTLTQNMFYSMEWGERLDLPVFDLFLNGQRFPFTTAAFDEYPVPQPPDFDGINLCTARSQPDTRCVVTECYKDPVSGNNSPCLLAFKRVYNYRNSGYLALTVVDPRIPYYFDLNFNGVSLNLDDDEKALADDDFRKDFAWQWQPVALVAPGTDLSPLTNALGGPVGILTASETERPSLDIDGDFEEETIFEVSYNGSVVKSVKDLDSQNGDINPNHVPQDVNDTVGLQSDSQMYSFTYDQPSLGDGTYFEVKEGKLFTTAGIFIRNTNRNDHVDLIMRIIKLSNNTYRFCTKTENSMSQRVDWTVSDQEDPAYCGRFGWCGMTNPVEACVPDNEAPESDGCFKSDRVALTCYDQRPDRNTIFVRSRIKNTKGIRWLTRTDVK